MTAYSDLLRLTKQATGENVDTWGDVFNAGTLEMLEDSIAGLVSFSVTSGDATLTTVNGAADQARSMILQITGNPGAARNVIVPALSKVYLANNKTTGGQTITIKTAAGTGVALTANKPTWVYCDGTNVLGATHAATATDATNVTSTLNGVSIATFARLDTQQNWQKSQATSAFTLTDAASIVVPLETSNKFRLVLGGNRSLSAPVNTLNGISFEILVIQDATGGRTLSYATQYRFPGNVAPTLTTTANRADLLCFSYDLTSNRYIGSIIQNFNLS